MKKILRLKRNTIKGYFQLGTHKIERVAKEFNLSKADQAELKGKGPQYYIEESTLPAKRIRKQAKYTEEVKTEK